ncbi:ATP-dependent RNA helicase RhlB [uncultured archaeon]|nr:ATP-dependent RNA helicase RhlB [uncultured archaeon]
MHVLTLPEVLTAIRNKYGQSLLDKAVSIFTPFPKTERLTKLKLSQEAIEFIKLYEPHAESDGLFLHQFRLFDAYARGAKNFILTSATGSGKSLCFWAWVIDRLSKNTNATALLCFPTQALMWGQADRLARISKKSSLRIYDDESGNAYSGTLQLANQEIDWTIWKGVGHGETLDIAMQRHERTIEFSNARIRLATLDKAHWSLIGSHIEFTKNLECIVIDEAHQYDGIFGANVLYFLKRLYVAKETAKRNIPNVFLASATLSDAKSFAAKLLSLNEKVIHHEKDAINPEIKIISLDDAETLLKNPPLGGILRVAICVDSLEEIHDLTELLNDTDTIGNRINILYFSDSKFQSRMLNRELESTKDNNRTVVIYDADLTPPERRQIEAQFNKGTMLGGTLIATNAIELGVDIENLDLCLLNTIPSKRVDLIQRIGRVGRRQDHPGLVLLNLSAAPFDRYIAKNLDVVFRFDASKSVPIPMNLELLRLRHMEAAHYEGCYRNYAEKDWNHYCHTFEKYFENFLDKDEIKNTLEKRYSGLLDLSDKYWVHKGFRASASEGKIPLRVIGKEKYDVAWIEDFNIFRDAHPEAVYLDARGHRWRVKFYGGKWKQAEWEHPDSKVVLAKYLKSIDVVYVEKVKDLTTTRGIPEESFEFYMSADPPAGVEFPANGEIDYGIWEYSKKFTGYNEINISTRKSKQVSLAEISQRFKNAVDAKEDFPFLFPLSYRTYGWSWNCQSALKRFQPQYLKEIEGLVSHILVPYLADAVQANPSNIEIKLSLSEGYLRVLDASPGGNGLSEVLLRDGCLSSAFSACLDALNQYENPKMKTKFKSYVLQLCQEDATHDAGQVIDIIRKLQSYWGR